MNNSHFSAHIKFKGRFIMEIVKITVENFQTEVSKSEKPVLIDFYADWCNPCKMLAPEVQAFAEETDEVKVCKLNVDECIELAQIYGVMSIPTLILVKNGKEVARRVGGCEKQDIADFCKANM